MQGCIVLHSIISVSYNMYCVCGEAILIIMGYMQTVWPSGHSEGVGVEGVLNQNLKRCMCGRLCIMYTVLDSYSAEGCLEWNEGTE